jgi:acyl-CoA thioesterase
MSTVASAVKLHFQTHHRDLNQPDLIIFHIEYLSRTSVGPGTFTIHELKLGRQFSTVRVQLLQQDSKSGKQIVCFEALVTQGNLSLEAISGGRSLPTPPYLAKEDIPERADCEEWLTAPEWIPRRPAAFKLTVMLPKGSDSLAAHPKLGPSVREQWVKWRKGVGETFDVGSLAYLADAFKPLTESFGLVGYWYPTMSFGMEVKRKFDIKEGGWEWLFLRIEMHEVRNGRFDLEVLIFNEEGEVVAISRQTSLIVEGERNYKGRAEKI